MKRHMVDPSKSAEYFIKMWYDCEEKPYTVSVRTGWARSTVYRLARKYGLFTSPSDPHPVFQNVSPKPVPKYQHIENPTHADITRNIVALIKERDR